MTSLTDEARQQIVAELARAQATLRRRRGALQTSISSLEAEIADLDRIASGLATAQEILRAEQAGREQGAQA